MISCVNPFVLSLQCFSFKSCDMGLAQLCHHGVIVVTSVAQLCQCCVAVMSIGRPDYQS